ncbi:CIA30 family protein [Ancylothrix sp. C2]|uniref:CIA30 family protein n=1 Tax=Ancylothrix sp. D3o TaxID=2953691 RepID=UPI0021BB4502|nr:CIA30 family protein [Ancylothrix sp. D3o]MCT7950364.1 CIA30 family protein [Ancylothrix sp. D3o]
MTQEKTKWDAGRFIKTLAYFGVIPFIGSLSGLQQLFKGKAQKEKTPKPQRTGIILVAGATGGVGKRVVKKLLEKNYQVRALVRDSQRAKEILGNKVEIIEGDITISETLNENVMKDISAVICCTGTRVQPVEGDTPNREKYYQGIKFYLPEVVDIPEIVEYKGIQNLVQATRKILKRGTDESLIFDFTQPTQDLKETWGALDDIVMGGASESSIRLVENTGLFSGYVSVANSGGFASVRTRNFDPPIDLTGYTGIDLRIKGDGKRYKFIIRNDPQWDSLSYCYSFDTVYDIWITVRIPFKDLIPVFRAKTVPEAKSFDPSHITSFQLMLSKFEYDGALNPKFEAGIFQMQLEYIKAYGGKILPQFVQISSAGVTRPGRPGINLEEEPPAVRLNDQLGGILTWKLRGEDAIRSSGLTYTIIRPCALTEEPGGKALKFEQGDNIRGKVSREDIAELCLQVLEEPKLSNVTFEVKESYDLGDKEDLEKSISGLKADR